MISLCDQADKFFDDFKIKMQPPKSHEILFYTSNKDLLQIINLKIQELFTNDITFTLHKNGIVAETPNKEIAKEIERAFDNLKETLSENIIRNCTDHEWLQKYIDIKNNILVRNRSLPVNKKSENSYKDIYSKQQAYHLESVANKKRITEKVKEAEIGTFTNELAHISDYIIEAFSGEINDKTELSEMLSSIYSAMKRSFDINADKVMLCRDELRDEAHALNVNAFRNRQVSNKWIRNTSYGNNAFYYSFKPKDLISIIESIIIEKFPAIKLTSHDVEFTGIQLAETCYNHQEDDYVESFQEAVLSDLIKEPEHKLATAIVFHYYAMSRLKQLAFGKKHLQRVSKAIITKNDDEALNVILQNALSTITA